MSCWLTIPSARPPEEAEKVLKLWRERGYKIALFRDYGPETPPAGWERGSGGYYDWKDTYVRWDVYPGYAAAVNYLIDTLMVHDPQAEWFIAAGDDCEPDLNHSAEEIAAQCSKYFARRNERKYDFNPHTFGVMQPTGDRWQDTPQSRQQFGQDRGAPIDRVAGSAWIGRGFAQRMYGGKGPLWPGYQHMFVDEELQEVAVKMGVFWQRRDLTQIHRHWGREPHPQLANPAKIPPHLIEWNTPEHWKESKKMFDERKRLGFPGHEEFGPIYFQRHR